MSRFQPLFLPPEERSRERRTAHLFTNFGHVILPNINPLCPIMQRWIGFSVDLRNVVAWAQH